VASTVGEPGGCASAKRRSRAYAAENTNAANAAIVARFSPIIHKERRRAGLCVATVVLKMSGIALS
jgi:hypothetical protein